MMDDLRERVDKLCERVMGILEQRMYDDEMQQDLRGLLQSMQLLEELLKLQSGDAAGSSVTVVMEGDCHEYGG